MRWWIGQRKRRPAHLASRRVRAIAKFQGETKNRGTGSAGLWEETVRSLILSIRERGSDFDSEDRSMRRTDDHDYRGLGTKVDLQV